MEWPMLCAGNTAEIVPGMTLFAHMILMASDSVTAMCLGRTCLTSTGAPEPLSIASLDLVSR
jgi:Xaa-Pro dipeptidase